MMSNIKYFIMLHYLNEHPMPIVDDNDNVELWDSEEQAEEWVKDNDFAQAFGYTIYEWNN